MQPRARMATEVGNDPRSVRARPQVRRSSITVIVPVHERTGLLHRTLAGLVAQGEPELEVLVCDDGSREDVAGCVGSVSDRLAVQHLRQERDGYGAARARNLGARAATGDVLLFLDADCIPVPGFVEAHRSWHDRVDNVLVVGPRRDVDSSDWPPPAIAAGRVDLHAEAGVDRTPPRTDQLARVVPDDWRAVLHRRTKGLLLGDQGFRSATTANLSVPRWLFERVGGFDERFRAWGGEDTELAWRLWNEGAVVAVADDALVLHQVQLDRTDRAGHRGRTVPSVVDRVPTSFYRPRPTPLAVVPTVSWVVRVTDRAGVELAEQWLSRAAPADVELVLHGPTAVLGDLVEAAAHNDRRAVVADDDVDAAALAAIVATRGELVAVVDHVVERPEPRVERSVRVLRDQDAAVHRTAYVVEGDRYLRLDDLDAVDAALRPDGLPVLAVARRRELVKQLHATGSAGAAWAALRAGAAPELSVVDPVRLRPSAVLPRPGTPGVRDVVAAGPRELVRAAVRAARSVAGRSGDGDGRTGASGGGASAADDGVGIPCEYVGLTGKDNLGDDAVRLAIERLMPWARFGVGVPDARLVVVGGGTLINGKRYYQNRMLRADSPACERVLFGTGVRSPSYWGVTEPMGEWFAYLDHSIHSSLRGPDSVANLRELGYDRDLPIIGDPAFSLTPSATAPTHDGRVVVCPVWTDGNCHGGDDAAVFAALARTIRRLRTAGREVVLMSAFPLDDRWCIELMRQAGAPDLPYVAGYDDVDDAVDVLAGADLVVGERLHAAILAASAGTAFVAIEYRPKVRDFARSVDQEDAVVRTDEMARLDEVVDTVLAERTAREGVVASEVERYRRLQREAAASIRAVLEQQ